MIMNTVIRIFIDFINSYRYWWMEKMSFEGILSSASYIFFSLFVI